MYIIATLLIQIWFGVYGYHSYSVSCVCVCVCVCVSLLPFAPVLSGGVLVVWSPVGCVQRGPPVWCGVLEEDHSPSWSVRRGPPPCAVCPKRTAHTVERPKRTSLLGSAVAVIVGVFQCYHQVTVECYKPHTRFTIATLLIQIWHRVFGILVSGMV